MNQEQISDERRRDPVRAASRVLALAIIERVDSRLRNIDEPFNAIVSDLFEEVDALKLLFSAAAKSHGEGGQS